MPSIKLIILFALVLFGAYTEHEADKTVKKIRSDRERMKRPNETSAADHEFMKRPIALSDVAARDNHGHPFGSVVGIEKASYCIPQAGIKTINEALSAEHTYEELTRSPGERAIPEMQIMVEEAGQYPGDYTSP